jgi:hypothetical protein
MWDGSKFQKPATAASRNVAGNKQIKMRLLIIGLIYFGTILNAIGQEIKIERSTEKELLISPFPLHSVREFTDNRYIAIKMIELKTIIGPHPDSVGQEVVLSDFLLLVKERSDDKADESTNFWVKGQFYNPRDFKFSKADKSLTFKHGTIKNSKTTTLIVSTKEIKIK